MSNNLFEPMAPGKTGDVANTSCNNLEVNTSVIIIDKTLEVNTSCNMCPHWNYQYINCVTIVVSGNTANVWARIRDA